MLIETIGSSDGGCDRSGATARQYVLRDHLGSVDVLTDAAGNIDGDMRFDAWGLRSNTATGQALSEAARRSFDHCATTRGFTNHEMLDELGIVHMNGRIYDPLLARFLQADPVVQFPSDLQNHNRYSYVLNNPLAYTDPSGHLIFSLGAMILAAKQGLTVVTMAVIGAAGFADAMLQGASFEQALQSGFLSGISAAAFSGIGNVVGTHFGGTFAAGLSPTGFGLSVALHGTLGGITSTLQGGKFGHGFVSGAAAQVVAGPINALPWENQRVIASAMVGGTISTATGGKFASGATTAAFSRAISEQQTRWMRSQQASFGGPVDIETSVAIPGLSADVSSVSMVDATGTTPDLSPPPIVEFEGSARIATRARYNAAGIGGFHTNVDRQQGFEGFLTGGFSAESLRRQHLIYAGTSLATVPAGLIVPSVLSAAPLVAGVTSHAVRIGSQIALHSKQAMIPSTMALEINAASVSFTNQLLIQTQPDRFRQCTFNTFHESRQHAVYRHHWYCQSDYQDCQRQRILDFSVRVWEFGGDLICPTTDLWLVATVIWSCIALVDGLDLALRQGDSV